MDLDRLRCFRRVVELGSVSKAASDLGISQPALTRQIKKLEHESGSVLLIRNSRGVSPTEAGEFLFAKAKTLLDQARLIDEDLAAWRGSLSGDIALCMPSSLHHAVTSPLVDDIRKNLPDVRLSVIDGFDALLHDQFRDGLVDLGILVHDPDRRIEGVDQLRIAQEPLLLMARRSAFAKGARLKIDDLRALEFVLPGRRNSLRQHIDALFLRRGKKPIVAMEIDSWRLAHERVMRGDGVTIVPASGVMSSLPAGIGCWPIAGASITWARCVRRSRHLSPLVREVCRRLDQRMRSDVGKSLSASWSDRA